MAVLYLDPFTTVYCCRAVVSEDAKTALASGLQTLSLERESYTVSQCVRPWIKLTMEYPFKQTQSLTCCGWPGLCLPLLNCLEIFIVQQHLNNWSLCLVLGGMSNVMGVLFSRWLTEKERAIYLPGLNDKCCPVLVCLLVYACPYVQMCSYSMHYVLILWLYDCVCLHVFIL